MPIAAASRQLISPKWCPSCSLALLRALASAAGSPLPRARRPTYRSLKTAATAKTLRLTRTSRTNAVYTRVLTPSSRPYSHSARDEFDDWKPPEYLETEDGEFITVPLTKSQKKRHNRLLQIHESLEDAADDIFALRGETQVGGLERFEAKFLTHMLHSADERELADENGDAADSGDGAWKKDVEDRLRAMGRRAKSDVAEQESGFLPAELAGLDSMEAGTDAARTQVQFLRETESTIDAETAGEAPAVSSDESPAAIPKLEANGAAAEAAEHELSGYEDLQAEIQEMEVMIHEDLETRLTEILIRKGEEQETTRKVATMRRSVRSQLDEADLSLQEIETKLGTSSDASSDMTIAESTVRTLDAIKDMYESLLTSHRQARSDTRELADALRSQIEDVEMLLQELEEELDAPSTAPTTNPEDIDYQIMEPAASPQSSTDTPWYLQSPLQPAPRRFISPLIEQIPPLPPNLPETLEPLLDYLLKDLSLSKLKIMDLRGLDPVPALGPNVLMILATARSERHMHIAADKCCRFMRGMLDGADIYADGLMGTGEMKLRERRERRKGKRRTAEDEEALRVGWICINSGQGLVVQVLTGWKREELNLEGLWSRKINTSQKRKLRDQLAAEGLSVDEIKARVAAELPYTADLPPEYDSNAQVEEPEEFDEVEEVNAVRTPRMPRARVAKIVDVLPPPGKRGVQMEEFRDVLKTVEIHSKSRKKEEGRRYIDIPAHKPRRVSTRGKAKAAKVTLLPKVTPVRERPSVTFSTKFDDFPGSARKYSTIVEAPRTRGFTPPPLDIPQQEVFEAEQLAKDGRYKELLKLYPRPRTDGQTTLVLIAHLNHLVLLPPDTAREALLAADADTILNTPFFLSFERSLPFRSPSPTHNHVKLLLYVAAHTLSPLTFPLNRYIRLLTNIRQSGLQVPLVSYHVALRALAISPALRGDPPKTMKFWTSRTTDTLALMTSYLLRHMDVAGIDVGHDPEVFESIWLALSPLDTYEYITTLGDPALRSPPIDHDKPFSRAVDHRVSLYKEFHMRWYNPLRFVPRDCSYLRSAPVSTATLNRLLHPSLSYPPLRPENRYDTLPSYLVTVFVTLARARAWKWLKHFWRWLPSQGVQRPKTLYALYLELLAREANVGVVITELRVLLNDYEREFGAGREEPADGVAEGLLACVELVDAEVPDWQTRSSSINGRPQQLSSSANRRRIFSSSLRSLSHHHHFHIARTSTSSLAPHHHLRPYPATSASSPANSVSSRPTDTPTANVSCPSPPTTPVPIAVRGREPDTGLTHRTRKPAQDHGSPNFLQPSPAGKLKLQASSLPSVPRFGIDEKLELLPLHTLPAQGSTPPETPYHHARSSSAAPTRSALAPYAILGHEKLVRL
ncbi:hypothetical protein Dda_6228 [Drechslerella dactyloides]|uniref:ATPase synthesis protein 25 n=1 Tax=Drechslerella dactyloides TaxID=74499 RepID=A0AAD6NJS7_DREDA|nr:hypothetical protein Dda_6228 [Drechslerella dactyloides]